MIYGTEAALNHYIPMKIHLALLATAALLSACAGKPQTPPQPTAQYVCDGGAIPAIAASYEDQFASLTIQTEDKRTTHTLINTPSPNGKRYTDARTNPAKPGRLVWYTNADKAILYVVTTSPEHPYRYEKQIADCSLRK